MEVFEARIYDEAMNILLSTDSAQPNFCGQCRAMSTTSTSSTNTPTATPYFKSSASNSPLPTNNNANNLVLDVLSSSLLRQHLKVDTLPGEIDSNNLTGMTAGSSSNSEVLFYF